MGTTIGDTYHPKRIAVRFYPRDHRLRTKVDSFVVRNAPPVRDGLMCEKGEHDTTTPFGFAKSFFCMRWVKFFSFGVTLHAS
jgi:hypothetical protein